MRPTYIPARLAAPVLVLACVAAAGCQQQTRLVPEVVAARAATLPAGPHDEAWLTAPEHVAKMIPQDLVEPRLLKPTTGDVRVRAITDGRQVVFRLEWADGDPSDRPGPGRMVDACAIQIPRDFAPEPPAPQMGDDSGIVEVTYWRADWQATVDGRGDSIRDLYPNASIDHYPADAASLEQGSAAQKEMALRYSPARALGNVRGGPRSVPVEDLVATGPGTLGPGPSLGSNGKGVHRNGGWSVTISRPWPAGVGPGQRTYVALAVWQGSEGEVGARKMRTGWIPLLVQVEET
jgi:DMSO reductase family type II enzyme heme b subunit